MPPVGKKLADVSNVKEAWKRPGREPYKEAPERYLGDERYNFETPYYGYSHVDLVTHHGDRCGGHYQQWFRETAQDWRALHDVQNELPH